MSTLVPTWQKEESLHISSFILTDPLCSMMKHFSLDGSGVLQDDTVPFTWNKGSLSGLICVKIMQIIWYGLHSPDLNAVGNLWEILDQCVRQPLHHYYWNSTVSPRCQCIWLQPIDLYHGLMTWIFSIFFFLSSKGQQITKYHLQWGDANVFSLYWWLININENEVSALWILINSGRY